MSFLSLALLVVPQLAASRTNLLASRKGSKQLSGTVVLFSCNASDAFQKWSSPALQHPGGEAAPLSNHGSGACLSTAKTDMVTTGPCGKDASTFRLDRDTKQIAVAGTAGDSGAYGTCLDVWNGGGPVVDLFSCHTPFDGGFNHQQFTYNATTGLLWSISAPGQCLAVSTSLVLPRLKIDPRGIISTGSSSGGDMAIQFHMAFSSSVSGVCGHDAQPYHCAATRFPGDNLVLKSPESSTPHCMGCDPGKTLVYDHCKNHPQWVDVGMLPDYPRRVCGDGGRPGCIDDVANLYDTSVYLSRGECRTYIGGAEVNSMALYAQMVYTPDKQVKYTDNCNPDGTGRGIDVDDECIQHVLGPGSKSAMNKTGPATPLKPPRIGKIANLHVFEQAPYLDDFNVGFGIAGFLYVPDMCKPGSLELPPGGCKLLVSFHGCGGNSGISMGSKEVMYAESNGFVLLHPGIKKGNNVSATYRNAFEIQRGCWDGYGQLTEDYALQSAPHMRNVFRMVQHLSGLELGTRRTV